MSETPDDACNSELNRGIEIGYKRGRHEILMKMLQLGLINYSSYDKEWFIFKDDHLTILYSNYIIDEEDKE